MMLCVDRSVIPGPTRQYGFTPANELTGSIPTSEVLLADLTKRRHVCLLHREISLALPFALSLVELDFEDDHPEQWHQSVQDDGALCLAVGNKTSNNYPEIAHLLADCELLQVNLAVRGTQDGVTTGPPA